MFFANLLSDSFLFVLARFSNLACSLETFIWIDNPKKVFGIFYQICKVFVDLAKQNFASTSKSVLCSENRSEDK